MVLPHHKLYFGNRHCTFKQAHTIIVPISYERTTFYLCGTAKAPEAILNAAQYLTEYNHELKQDITATGFFTLKTFYPNSKTIVKNLEAIEQYADKLSLICGNKFIIFIGGEHTISFPLVKVLHKKYSQLSVLHLDAHADLQDKNWGSPWSHACVMRRISELGIPITHVGIRGLTVDEAVYLRRHPHTNIFYGSTIPIKKVLSTLNPEVYISLDLDVFDPGFMPFVGTPEPGGVSWEAVVHLFKQVASKHNLIGADFVEFRPVSHCESGSYTVAKLMQLLAGYRYYL